jgi:hypothetical protein
MSFDFFIQTFQAFYFYDYDRSIVDNILSEYPVSKEKYMGLTNILVIYDPPAVAP